MAWFLDFLSWVLSPHVSQDLLFHWCHHYPMTFWYHSHFFFFVSIKSCPKKGSWLFSFESLTSLFSSDFPTTGPLQSLANGDSKTLPHFSYYSLVDMWYFPGNTGWLSCGLIFSGQLDTFLAPSAITHTDATITVGLFLPSCVLRVGEDTLSLSFVINFIHGF